MTNPIIRKFKLTGDGSRFGTKAFLGVDQDDGTTQWIQLGNVMTVTIGESSAFPIVKVEGASLIDIEGEAIFEVSNE